jgi:hypothetical protein
MGRACSTNGETYLKYGFILKKTVQHLSTNSTPDDDPIWVETCVFKILM